MTNLHKNWFKNDCHQIILSQINTYPKFHLQRFQIDQNEEENERMRIRAKTGFRKIRMPLVSLITRKWSCGCNELTDRLLQNFSTSKHARRRNTVPPPSPFSPLSALCTCTPICTVHFSSFNRSRFTANLPRATGNFPRSNGERIPRTSFHKKQFRGEILPDTLHFLVKMPSISRGNSIWMNQFEFYRITFCLCFVDENILHEEISCLIRDDD